MQSLHLIRGLKRFDEMKTLFKNGGTCDTRRPMVYKYVITLLWQSTTYHTMETSIDRSFTIPKRDKTHFGSRVFIRYVVEGNMANEYRNIVILVMVIQWLGTLDNNDWNGGN
eukprot:884466_1